MTFSIFRSFHPEISVMDQEEHVGLYSHNIGMGIDRVYVCFSPSTKELSDRPDFQEFLQEICPGDTLIVYDLWALSYQVGELVKIMTCIFRKNAYLHLSAPNLVLERDTPSFLIVGMLNDLRDHAISKKNKSFGRPRGSRSQSKFDGLRPKILELLKENSNVSEISRALNVNRSSLKDYIFSRKLKEIALAYKKNEESERITDAVENSNDDRMKSIECPFDVERRLADSTNASQSNDRK